MAYINTTQNFTLQAFEQFNNSQHFEVHVTIFPTDEIEDFVKVCNSYVEFSKQFTEYKGIKFDREAHVVSCKPILIELPEGKFQQQPMCSTYIYGNLVQAIKYGELFSYFVEKSNSKLKVSRNKVEARLHNVDNRINLNSSLPQYEGKYWEFHIKLAFHKDKILKNYYKNYNLNESVDHYSSVFKSFFEEFRQILTSKFPNTRLSKSAMSHFDKLNENITTRIVTLRIYNYTKIEALTSLEILMKYLQSCTESFFYQIRGDVEKELSVYDSNVKHDIGWISMIDNKCLAKNDLTLNILLLMILLLLIFWSSS